MSSESTRAAILAAARDQFAAEGYERATIRSIARQADIDPAMVMRYYGNKEKLFAAAAEFDLHIPDLSEIPMAEHGTALVRAFLNRWETDESMIALLRASVTYPAATEKTRALFTGQVAPALLKVADDPATVPRRAGLIATQVMGFALCRYILRLPPVVDFTPEEAIEWLGPTLQRYLTA